MNQKLYIIPLLIVCILTGGYFFSQQGKGEAQPTSIDSSKIQVVASFYPLAFMAERIAGDLVQVQTITPAGTEPHDYDPSAQDIATIEQAKLLVLNGGVESWGERIKQNLKGTNVQIVVAGEGLSSKQIAEEGQTIADPHVWLDPVLVKAESKRIADALIQIDSAHTSEYRKNETALDAELDKLDRDYKMELTSCGKKDIITSHAAFGYLAVRYGFTQIPIAGISPDEEPSAKTLATIVDFVRKNDVKYIFSERLVSPKLARTIATEVGAQTLVLDPLEGISNVDVQTGKNYFTIMRENLQNLRIALECK